MLTTYDGMVKNVFKLQYLAVSLFQLVTATKIPHSIFTEMSYS